MLRSSLPKPGQILRRGDSLSHSFVDETFSWASPDSKTTVVWHQEELTGLVGEQHLRPLLASPPNVL